MMRALKLNEIVFDEWPDGPPPKLIKKPEKRSKHKSWHSYYKWWLRQQVVEIWMNIDCSMPFQRSQEFQVSQIQNPDSWDV